MRAVEAKNTMKEKAAEIKRAYDLLLEKRLEKEGEGLEGLERRVALLNGRYYLTSMELKGLG